MAIIAALAAYLAHKRDRRRTLYSEATRAAVRWKEFLYRVRRREKGQERDLIQGFHGLQDELSYYQAWVGGDSKYMKRSYEKFVGEVKERTGKLIVAAWEEPIRAVPGNARPDDTHPDLSDVTDAFLKDVRSHLSPWPWRKLASAWRNRKGK